MTTMENKTTLLVMDIDNTVFDWVAYYTNSFWSMLEFVGSVIDSNPTDLAHEARDVFESHGSIEYPFVIQELPSVMAHYGENIDLMLTECVNPARELFLQKAKPYLSPYETVISTLAEIKRQFPNLPIVALTDAPRYVAMWKLNKLEILNYFSAVYGLADPRLPTCEKTQRVKVNPAILLKHLQQSSFDFPGKIRILPDEYEKPGTRGLKTVLMDYELDETPELRNNVVWVGDNLRKDVGLGKRLGVRTGWARYGANVPDDLLARLAEFSPPLNIHKNANLPANSKESPVPDVILEQFSDILSHI